MHTPDPLPRAGLTDLERRLSAWAPAAGSLDRDRMLFEAGRAAARFDARARWTTALAAVLAALAVGLGGWAVGENARRRELELALAERARAAEVASTERIQTPAPAPIPVEAPAPESYLVLTRRLATLGLDGLATPLAPSAPGRSPAGPGRPLTPLSAGRAGDLMDL